MKQKSKIISVIIPVYNEENYIGKCLGSLFKQTFSNFEVIVIDDGSTDRTHEIVRKFKRVNLINGEHKGPGFSRNLGAKQARGEILVFVDADMIFDKNYIKNLTAPLKERGITGTTHDCEIAINTKNIWSRCWGRVRISKEDAKDIKIFRAIRRDKFLEMGGFDPKYGYADDQSLWIKHRVKPVVAPDTICYHRNPESLREVYKQSRWIGASLDNKILNLPLIKYLAPFLLVLLVPLAIPLLAIRKTYEQKNIGLIFPMLVFMIARYFGTIEGIFRKVYLRKNVR